MRYKVEQCDDAEELGARIQELVNDGWQLQGGIAIAPDGSGTLYAQALIHPHDPPAQTLATLLGVREDQLPKDVSQEELTEILGSALRDIKKSDTESE